MMSSFLKCTKMKKTDVIKNVKALMENALPLDVKMHVEYQAGKNLV